MKSAQSNEQVIGGAAAASAYVLWGILPIYWKWIHGASAEEVLAHRIIWSFVFMLIIILLTRSLPQFSREVKELVHSPKRLASIALASLFISVNWYTFIWSVAHGHVVEASLGYYINPLISVLLGVIFLKEKLSLLQIVSFLLASAGVLLMTVEAGVFPWISLLLAVTFGVYGLLKKTVHLSAMSGLTIETLFIAPAALAYLLWGDTSAAGFFPSQDPVLITLLVGAGIVTAVPLLLFAAGANRISLTMIGFFQYIAPTIMLILGTLLYGEAFDVEHLLSFLMIWFSLLLFTLSKAKWYIQLEERGFKTAD